MNDNEPLAIMMGLITGFVPSAALHVAAKLEVADRLAERSMSAAELAAAAEVDPSSLYRVLRCLASLGVFAEGDDGRFANTPMSDLLRADHPRSLQAWATLVAEKWVHDPWGHVLECVRTGEPVFERSFGMDAWSYLATEAEAARSFHRAMSGGSRLFANAILAAYDFGPVQRLVDVGGGDGSFLAEVLRAHPEMVGTLLERPEIAPMARRVLGGLPASVVEGSFFDSVPEGGDVYVLKWILHDWNDERARHVLERCRQAMKPRARLLVVERVLPPGNVPSDGKILDLNMMVLHGGRERSETEFNALLRSAGLRPDRVVSTASPLAIIEASIATAH